MRGSCSFLIFGVALLGSSAVQAQGGIRAIFWNVEPVTVGLEEDAFSYGLGYDHDLNDRLSWGLSLRLLAATEGWALTYRSAYHFSDNGHGSFYMGPTLGLRSFGNTGIHVPIGLRMGVRGGLERFYADLYVGAQYIAGASGKAASDVSGAMDLRQGSYSVGIDLGWGWARRKDNW